MCLTISIGRLRQVDGPANDLDEVVVLNPASMTLTRRAAGLSFAFYGYWDWRFVPLLGFSILLNWLIAEAFQKTKAGALITLAIVANLAVLAVFKYFNFFADLAAMIPGFTNQSASTR